MKEIDVLETIAWGMKNFGSVCTNRQLPLRDMRRAMANGLAECVGLVSMCDDDCFAIQPERYRLGYTLTKKGKRAIESHYKCCPLPVDEGELSYDEHQQVY